MTELERRAERPRRFYVRVPRSGDPDGGGEEDWLHTFVRALLATQGSDEQGGAAGEPVKADLRPRSDPG